MATKTSIWFDGDEYRWNDKYNDYVCRKIVDGQIVETQYQLARERRFRADRLAKAAEEQENETETPKYSRRSGREMHGLTVLYLKTGDNRYADAAYRLMKQNGTTGEKVEYAAQGYGGQTQGAKGYGGGSKKAAVWFNGYKYEFDQEKGEYIRYVNMGGVTRPFTLKQAKEKAAKDAKKDPKKARELKKKAKKIIDAAQRSVKGKTKEWSETQSTKDNESLGDRYTCMTFGNHLRKTWAAYTVTVALMKKRGYSQDKIDKFTKAALDKTLDIFRRAYKHNGGVEAAISVMQGFSPTFANTLRNTLGVIKSEHYDKYTEATVRRLFSKGAKVIAEDASSDNCQKIAKQLLGSYKKGLAKGYMNLSSPRDADACRKAFENWKQKQKQEKPNVATKQAKGRPTSTDGRPVRSSEGTSARPSGGSGSGTPKTVERRNDAGGTNGSGTSDQKDRVVAEPRRKIDETFDNKLKYKSYKLWLDRIYNGAKSRRNRINHLEDSIKEDVGFLENAKRIIREEGKKPEEERGGEVSGPLWDLMSAVSRRVNERKGEFLDAMGYANKNEPHSVSDKFLKLHSKAEYVQGKPSYESRAKEAISAYEDFMERSKKALEICKKGEGKEVKEYRRLLEWLQNYDPSFKDPHPDFLATYDVSEPAPTNEPQSEPPKEASQSALASEMSDFVAAAMERKRDEEARNKSDNPPTEPPKIIEEPVTVVQAPREPGLTPGVPEKVDYNQVYEVPIDHLKVDPKRFQFKLGGDAETGASNLYSGTQFDLKLSNTIMVWRDPDDGNDYVVNGHHRMNIAKKSGYTGNMRVVYCDAKTANDAKVEGAIFNIADGKGTEIDVADVMRNCPDWENRPKVRQFISKNNKLAENGRALAGLSDKIYAEVKNGLLDWKLAAPIGKILAMGSLQGADEAQNQTYKIAFGTDGKKKTSADEVRRIAQEVLETNPIKNNDTMGFLFDNAADENDWQSVVQEATKMSKEVESFFSDEKKVNNFASKSKNTNKLNKSGVLKGETDAELAKKYADAAKTILDAFTNSNAEKYTTYRNIYINAKEKYRDFIEQNPQEDEKGRKKKRESLVAEIIGKFFDVYNDGLPKEKRVVNPMAAQPTQTEEEPQTETPKVEPQPEPQPEPPKVEEPKPEPQPEPPKTEEPQPAEPSKPVEPPKPAPKPKAKESTKPSKKPKEPKPKPAPKKKEEPKVVIDPKYRNAGNNLDDEDKALLRFIKKFIGDGKITNLESFLKDAARALSTKQEEVAPSFCRDIIDELVEKNYVDKDGENSYSLTERGHAAIYNFNKKKTAKK